MALSSLYQEPQRSEAIAPGALEFHDVFKIFRSGPAEAVSLRGLELRIEVRELVAILGPSGSGKSTALHLAAALEPPSAGEVRFFGQPLSHLDENELADYRARDVAIVFQSGNLWAELSARENVMVTLRLGRRRRDVRKLADRALGAFELSRREGIRAGSLSGGEQQRLAIAAAAAREAPLVLADEPTAELDVANERNVLRAFRRLRDEFGSTVVVVTHSQRVADFADRVVEIRDGRVA